VGLAAIAVFDVVTDDATFGADIAHRLAAGHRILADAVAPSRHTVADRAPRDRTCHGRGSAAVTLAHRAAQHTADHGAQQRSGRAAAAVTAHDRLLITLLRGIGHLHMAIDRVDPGHVGPRIMHARRINGARSLLGQSGPG